MATKQRADKQKEKERKEKIILIALVAVLVVVGAIELPKILKSGSSSGATVVGQTTTSTSTTPTSSGTSTGGTPASTSGGALGPLPNANGYEPGAGQLGRFSLFKSGDPFGSATTAANSTSTRPSTTSARSTTTTGQEDFAAAKIAVNGGTEIVAIGATFPAASPVFTLNSVTAKKIEISVAGGSFASGQSKVTVKKGRSVVLVNTVDSTRYSIKFVTALTASQLTSTTTATTTGETTPSGTTSGTTAGTTTSGTTT